MPEHDLEAALTVQRDPATRMGADRLRLLAAIRDHGSIAGAARAVGLSYKAAWEAVNAMNNLFSHPLVTASPGGRHGGGTVVTEAGLRVLDAFTDLQADLDRFLSRLARHLGDPDAPPSPVLWSLLMKTSARNMFHCTVNRIIEGPVNAEVVMDLTRGQQLTAIVTEQSLLDLALAPGREVFALVKSTFVMLAREEGLGRTSVRNRLHGVVSTRTDGVITSDIVLDIGDAKTVAAIITRESADALDLQPGTRACALVKASHVILAVD
ncbi:TOBE domain-containing protein [Pararhodospirillum oryzae]|uniref:Transcriptional regulator n=1 Tax=Pararhodospirillum oryzae TaxID=478448 RepID=A0A512H408_9PROT|nr:TOBE domain-containing protein [Pararhodospirillum oryzae]GEO80177.1 transcriptional regulator [Pararhodospirillum oryzae]